MGLLGDASFRPCVTGNGVKRMCSHERSNKLQQLGRKSRCPCDWGKITPPVWWRLIWICWGWGSNVFPHSPLTCDWLAMGDNRCWSWNICFFPRWFPVLRIGTKYQHKRYPCPKYYWKSTQIQEKPCRFSSWMGTEQQILLKREVMWANPFFNAKHRFVRKYMLFSYINFTESPKMLVDVLAYYRRFADECRAGTQYM